jgi:hypothetical protein
MTGARHFRLRLRRGGPLVPARIRWLDFAPEDPEWNKLDRGRLSIITVVDIAGELRPPEELLERLYSATDSRSAIAPTHWKFCERITEAQYEVEFARIRWAERHRPSDPVLKPRRKVDPAQIPMPDFTRENSI